MSGFDADWLALREVADTAARAQAVTEALGHWWANRNARRVVDLGCGTGANLRFLAPRLGGRQHWHLIDHDPVLLDQAMVRCARWAEAADHDVRAIDGSVEIHGPAFACRIEPHRRDLRDIGEIELIGRAELVTASALLDLTSARWCDRLAQAVVESGAALHVALSYNGTIEWHPADPYDGTITELLNSHQITDKGFGAALGPDASAYLRDRLVAGGHHVISGQSDWQLTGDQARLRCALIDQWSVAVREIDRTAAPAISDWARRRRSVGSGATTLTVGHTDIFACPYPSV